MKPIFLAIVVSSLLFIVTGCKDNIETMNNNFNKIEASNDSAAERENVTRFSDFSADKLIHYSLEVVNLKSQSQLNVADIKNNIDEKLEVIIYYNEGAIKKHWKPIDNNNIFILLRE